jgi:hypothetical protein
LALSLDALLINIIFSTIIISPVLWFSGRLIVGIKKARFVDAVLIVVIGTVVGTLFGIVFTGFIAAIIQLIIWLALIKYYYECGWGTAFIIAIISIILFIVVGVILGLVGLALFALF